MSLRWIMIHFHCRRCGNGYRSAFRHSVTGSGGRLAALGGGILGGEIGSRVQEVGLRAQWDRGSTRGGTDDKRLLEASEDVAGHFVQCRGCARRVGPPHGGRGPKMEACRTDRATP